ncbi:MAG TPA: Gfo/Idh/MocA family oxidoreductase [Verrucomicrobiota bacterium]|nr:Gfo/Idh/MocA family oxidoreductase [Verrucomicrobiota bacterium]HNT15634.1 Gfo/Idh/MocA family oxidoreductase [Verrucomicrobiota bacterium]
MKPIRWGILGAANIARKNWRAIRHSGNATLTAVASRDRARAGAFVAACQSAEPFMPPPVIYEDYEQLIASPEVDAVYVPLPTGRRQEWILRAARAGKHILSEKPCAVRLADLEEILAVCRQRGVQYMDGVMFAHNHRLQQLRQVLDDGTSIGALRRITTHFSFLGDDDFFRHAIQMDSSLEPLGCLGDLGWYGIRLALWAVNWQPPLSVSGRILEQIKDVSGRADVVTAFSGELVFPHGVSADFYCSFVAENSQWATLTGTKGYLRIPDFVLPFTNSTLAFEVNQIEARISGCDWRLEHTARPVAFQELETDPATAQETCMFRNFSRQVQSGTLNDTWPRAAWLTQQVTDACMAAARRGPAGTG